MLIDRACLGPCPSGVMLLVCEVASFTTGCPKTRDFIGAWLKLFLEMRELETERVGRVDVVVVGGRLSGEG